MLNPGWRGGSIGRASDSRFYDISDPSLNPIRSTRKTCKFFQVKNVVLTCCWCAQPPCVYYIACIRMMTYIMHVKDPVVYVRVWWITETGKDTGCGHSVHLLPGVLAPSSCASWQVTYAGSWTLTNPVAVYFTFSVNNLLFFKVKPAVTVIHHPTLINY